jgi:RimJ/RimL family protein N-acetyltransferase
VDFVPGRMSESQARRRSRTNRERAAAGSAGRYVVELDRQPLGTAGIAFPGRGPEVSYALLPAGRGAGLATAAVRSLVQWAAASGYPVVSLRIAEGNLASGDVARRAGFAKVDRQVDVDGTPVTVWVPAVSAPPPEAGGRS